MVYLKYTTGHFETGTKSRYLQPVESVQSLFCALKKKPAVYSYVHCSVCTTYMYMFTPDCLFCQQCTCMLVYVG